MLRRSLAHLERMRDYAGPDGDVYPEFAGLDAFADAPGDLE